MKDERLTEAQLESIMKSLKSNRKIEAIKEYREATGVGLKEAKEAVEELESESSGGPKRPELVEKSRALAAKLGFARMSLTAETLTLTTAQAIIRWLSKHYIEVDGQEMRVCGGGFGIFGHGNVTCLGEALFGVRDVLPLYRGHNEQSMGFAAAGYAKQWLRQRFMFATASAGPGTTNMLTSAGIAHTNRLPFLHRCPINL